jgi:hypothetical protein
MKSMSAMLAPLALAVLGSVAMAQGEQAPKPACPHTGIERVPASLRGTNTVACGAGVEMSIGGVRYSSPAGTCTLLVVYRPEFWVPVSTPGSNTFADPRGSVTELIFRFRCKTVYFLGFIPVDGDCLEIDPMQGGLQWNYVVRPCGG